MNQWIARGIDMSPERVGNHQENLPEQCVMDAASTTLKKLLPHLQHIIFEDSICQIQTGAASAKGQQGVARLRNDQHLMVLPEQETWYQRLPKLSQSRNWTFLQLHATTCLLFGIHGAEEGIRGQRIDLLVQIERWKLSRHCPLLNAIDQCFLRELL